MKNRLALALAMAVAGVISLASLPSSALAAPEPSVVVSTWELTFNHFAPERLILTTPDGQSKVVWYIRYKVTNNTGRDILFTPEFKLLTETGQLLSSTNDAAAFKAIKELYNNPLLDAPVQVYGKLRQGEDNAKESVAMFTGVDADARVLRFTVSGLSGDTAAVKDPLTGKDVVLYKTLVLEYEIPGQAIGIAPQPKFKSRKWVLK